MWADFLIFVVNFTAMSKKYEEMNDAEKLIMDYLQVYAFKRVNAKPPREKDAVEIVLEEIAVRLGLID